MSEIIEIEIPAPFDVEVIDSDIYEVNVDSPVIYEIEVEGIIREQTGIIPFTKVLTGTSITILEAEHGLTIVRGVRVYKTMTGEIIQTAEIILGTTVIINSNIDLTNYSLMIY